MQRFARASVCVAGPWACGSQDAAARNARPEEVADIVAYFALEVPMYLTGATFVRGGGLRA